MTRQWSEIHLPCLTVHNVSVGVLSVEEPSEYSSLCLFMQQCLGGVTRPVVLSRLLLLVRGGGSSLSIEVGMMSSFWSR